METSKDLCVYKTFIEDTALKKDKHHIHQPSYFKAVLNVKDHNCISISGLLMKWPEMHTV